MKKTKYLAVCMMAAVFALWAVGCSNRNENNRDSTSQGSTSGSTPAASETGSSGAGSSESTRAGNSGTDSTRNGNSGTDSTRNSNFGTDSSESGAGAGSTGSTEGETGLLDDLMRDVEDGLDGDNTIDGPGAAGPSGDSRNSGR